MIIDLKQLKQLLEVVSNFNQYGRLTLDEENKKIIITAFNEKLINIQVQFKLDYIDEVNENEI